VIDLPIGNDQGGNHHRQRNAADEQKKGEKQGLTDAAQRPRTGAPVAAFLLIPTERACQNSLSTRRSGPRADAQSRW
jgi:hypothetical protein